jgi:hypothetical protein
MMASTPCVARRFGGQRVDARCEIDLDRRAQRQSVIARLRAQKVGQRLERVARQALDIPVGRRAAIAIDWKNYNSQRLLPIGRAAARNPRALRDCEQDEQQQADTDRTRHKFYFDWLNAGRRI